MLAALIGGQLAAGLLLRGAWDVWAQSAVLLVLIAGAALGMAWSALRGRILRPALVPFAWASALMAASFLSARFGPVSAYALSTWAAAAAGLWLFPAVTLLSSQERVRIEQIIRAAAWLMLLLAVYQRFHGQARPPASLLNQNVFAGAILLLIPLAVRRGDGFLAVGLLLCLWWTRSAGAWLGLSAALILHRRAVGPLAYWGCVAAGLSALAVFCMKLSSPEVVHRWAWWTAAWRMAGDAPWRGLGPGAFAYALPAYVRARPELNSLFAHQHFLETAAERGWPYLLLWVAGLTAMLARAKPGARFGPIAALTHGLFDYALSVPGVFWLFCLSVAWSLPESEEAVAVRPGRKIWTVAIVLAAAGAAAGWVAGNWRADLLRARVIAGFPAALTREEAERALRQSEDLRLHPETARLRAEFALGRAEGVERAHFLNEAAAELERAVALDPYRASNRTLLEKVRGLQR